MGVLELGAKVDSHDKPQHQYAEAASLMIMLLDGRFRVLPNMSGRDIRESLHCLGLVARQDLMSLT